MECMVVEITPLDEWIAGRLGAGSRRLTREALNAWQLKRLKETIALARSKSRFYGERLARLSEDLLFAPEDLRLFPFTTAADIRNDPGSFLCVSQDEVSRVVTLHTSGTTGPPKRIYFSREDQERTIDFFRCGMSTLAGRGDRVLILLPGVRPGSVGDLLAVGLERLGAVPVAHGFVTDPRAALNVMERERIDVLVGVPVQVLALAKASSGRAAPRRVLLSTDHVPASLSGELRRLWGCEVFGHYGMTEMGFGGGLECGAHSGYHMREADLYFEIVRPETGEPAAKGEWGEVVFTTLTRKAMPLIRYRTGDGSRFLPEACSCATVLRTMEPIRSRVDSGVSLEGGGAFSMADLDEALFPVRGVVDFTASVTLDGTVECLRLQVHTVGEPLPGLDGQVAAALDAVSAIRSARVRGLLRVQVRVRRWEGFSGETAKRSIAYGRNRKETGHEHFQECGSPAGRW